MENRVNLRIGDLVFAIESDFPFPVLLGYGEDFVTDEEPADYTFRFRQTDSIPAYTGPLRLIQNAEFCHELVNDRGEYFRGLICKEQGEFYDAVLRQDDDEGEIVYLSQNRMAERFRDGFSVINMLALERLFPRRGGFFLHSSHVNVNGRALVFSAPSGTGKSTQAELWRVHAGAAVINGDRSLLRKRDGVWHAHGCPMCGTSGIHLQGAEPIHAIVMLEQGKDNSLVRLGAKEAFSLLYPQVTVPRWNRELVLTAMELLDSVIAGIPVYRYSCTKTEDAVFVLKDALGL